ncbi:hypothetical protein LOD99_5605 [Oopsacas minuta]|uniref:Uncharacterized protein n=1 Tax=Oopsacas minuta TaxID=111878 RepID=A0AAV7JPW0_9METZ|nr:hypothetical protein LOD99_5605 [Oopsacas minuta]
MNSSNEINPHRLARTIAGLSLPESPSGPFRNRRSLFIQKEKRASSISKIAPPDISETPSYTKSINPKVKSAGKKVSTPVHSSVTTSPIAISVDKADPTDTRATSSLKPTLDLSFSSEDGHYGYVARTPPLKRSYSRSSWYMNTDPGKMRVSSKLFQPDKKRRVSFKPSLEVTEFSRGAQNDPYSLPLNDSIATDTVPPIPADTLAHDVTSPIVGGESSGVIHTSLLSRPGQSRLGLQIPEDIFKNSVLLELRQDDPVGLNTTFDVNKNVTDYHFVPQQIKEALAKFVSDNRCSDTNKSVIAEYAPLHTSRCMSPAKIKLAFPPHSLDSLHPSLKYRRKKGSKSAHYLKVSIDKDNAVIPISFFKSWNYKNANSRLLPVSSSAWLQDYSTNLIEHFIKLIRARIERKTGKKGSTCSATPQDIVAVIREYLKLEDSVNINDLIHTYLPMELWFTYDPLLTHDP